MKKIILNKSNDSCLFSLTMYNEEEYIGKVDIYLAYNSKVSAWLDLYIDEKWRCRWLTKSFGKFLLQMLKETAKEYGLKTLCSSANNPRSPRLLDFFTFTKYNDEYYYLTI